MALLPFTIPSEIFTDWVFIACLYYDYFQMEVGLRLLLCPLGSNVVIRTACCTVGIALPVYSTFKAIEKKDQSEQEKWLLYWAAYGSFSLVEAFTDKVISWIPFYYHMKFAFLVWLQTGNGSKHLYARHLRPFLLKHQAGVDGLLSFLSKERDKFIKDHQGELQFFKAMATRLALTGSQGVKDVMERAQTPGLSNAIEGPRSSMGDQTPSSESDTEN